MRVRVMDTMSGPAAIIFDYSGTMADDIEATLSGVNYVIRNLAKGVSELTLNAFIERFESPLNFLRGLNIPKESAQQAMELFAEAYLKYQPNVRLFADVENSLIQMKRQNLQTGIVSSTPRLIVETILRKERAESFFDVIVGPEDCKELKPSPQPILRAVKTLGRQPKEVAYVGDMDEDVQAAYAAGTVSIAVWREHRHYQKLERLTSNNPSFLVKQLTEILSIKW